MLKGRVFITGGSGTLGRAIIQRATQDWPCEITVFNRSEYLQALLKQDYPHVNCVPGDVRDFHHLRAAMAGHDTVLHLAAAKRIPECEQYPDECWKTNVHGSQNVVDAALLNGVSTCLGISTDKACQPVTMYGASKLAMEKIFQAQPGDTCDFVLVRYGNVIESRGSVIPLWRAQDDAGEPLGITDRAMTRFWMTPEQAVDTVLAALVPGHGTVTVPKMKAMPITDMARAVVGGDPDFKVIGLRSAERLHEWLVSPDELAQEMENHYLLNGYGKFGHSYRSDTAPVLTMDEFCEMLEEVGVNG